MHIKNQAQLLHKRLVSCERRMGGVDGPHREVLHLYVGPPLSQTYFRCKLISGVVLHTQPKWAAQCCEALLENP